MDIDMAKIQAIISQTQKRAGLERICVISSLGIPVVSVGMDLDLGVQARTIFSVFDRACSMLHLGDTEHVCIDGRNRAFIVKPLRRDDKVIMWFVAVAPTFGGTGVFSVVDQSTALQVTATEVTGAVPTGVDEAEVISATMALWSVLPMLEEKVNLGETNGVYLDGTDGRIVVRQSGPECWSVAFPAKERRTGRVDVELDRAALTLLEVL